MLQIQVYYQNHMGELLFLLNRSRYCLEGELKSAVVGGDIMDYDWSLTTVPRYGSKGGRVTRFGRDVTFKQLTVQVSAASLGAERNTQSLWQYLDEMTRIFSVDVEAMVPGTLGFGTSRVKAYAYASTKTDWDDGVPFALVTINFAIESPYWYDYHPVSFSAYETTGGNGFRYPGKYPVKYCMTGGVKYINNWHYTDSPVIITVYGPATNPTFKVGDNVYAVYTSIAEGEQLVIDQLTNEVYRLTALGEKVNEFHSRSKNPSVFEPIPPGESAVYYSGNFAFKIVIVEQRSEPKWEDLRNLWEKPSWL